MVLIDELGRGTAPNEGIGISHAVAEELIRLKVDQKPISPFSDALLYSLLCSLQRASVTSLTSFSSAQPLDSHFSELSMTLARYPTVVK